MQTVVFPHDAWAADRQMAEIVSGMRTGRIRDSAAFDRRRRHVMRVAAARAMAAAPAAEVWFLGEHGLRVGRGLNWSLSIGRDAPRDDALAEWCDPYRDGLALIDARQVRDWPAADAIRARIAEAWGAEVRVSRDALLITTAERGDD